MRLTTLWNSSFFEDLKQNILDTLFPLYCLGCKRKGFWICDPCKSRIPRRLKQSCSDCLKCSTPYGQRCFACKDARSSSLDGIFVASYYQYPLLKYAIHSYKYRFLRELSFPLGDFLREELGKHDIPLPNVMIPVPLHRRRLKFRGFNQSALLATHLSEEITPGIAIPLLPDGLIRIRYTKPQMKTYSREERLANLHNAFAFTKEKESLIKDQALWLIDDVATTGTTLEECARLLKKHGAKSVFGIVLAR